MAKHLNFYIENKRPLIKRRYRQHIRHITSNTPQSTYAKHILHNAH